MTQHPQQTKILHHQKANKKPKFDANLHQDYGFYDKKQEKKHLKATLPRCYLYYLFSSARKI